MIIYIYCQCIEMMNNLNILPEELAHAILKTVQVSNEITETHSQNYEVVGYCTAKNSKPASVITWIAPPERFLLKFRSVNRISYTVYVT